MPIAEKNDELDAPQRETEVQFYADQAMAMLHDAVAKGYQNAAQMKTEKELDPLREREDFKKLLADLEAKNK